VSTTSRKLAERTLAKFVLADLEAAAAGRIFESGTEHWTYGWCVASYRRSPEAAIGIPSGRVRLTADGVEAYERAVSRLLESPQSQRWDPEELWGVVAELVASLPRGDQESNVILSARLNLLLSTKPSMVSFSLANVAWQGEPQAIANAVVGNADRRFLQLVQTEARGRPSLVVAEEPFWMKAVHGPPSKAPTVIFSAWVSGDGTRASDQALARFDDILGAGLLLLEDVVAAGFVPLRGDSHKPGVRGLTLHRPSLAGSKTLAKNLLHGFRFQA
jgi:hypothetical protein